LKLDRWVLAIGDPFNGITLVGLWTSGNEAVGYAKRHYSHEQWELVRLEEREDLKDDDEIPEYL